METTAKSTFCSPGAGLRRQEAMPTSNSTNGRSCDAPSAEAPTADDVWEEIEDKFRVWSFGIYYQKTFAEEPDLTLRFVKALVASAQPIRDRQAVIDWYEKHKRRSPRVMHCDEKHADAQVISM